MVNKFIRFFSVLTLFVGLNFAEDFEYSIVNGFFLFNAKVPVGGIEIEHSDCIELEYNSSGIGVPSPSYSDDGWSVQGSATGLIAYSGTGASVSGQQMLFGGAGSCDTLIVSAVDANGQAVSTLKVDESAFSDFDSSGSLSIAINLSDLPCGTTMFGTCDNLGTASWALTVVLGSWNGYANTFAQVSDSDGDGIYEGTIPNVPGGSHDFYISAIGQGNAFGNMAGVDYFAKGADGENFSVSVFGDTSVSLCAGNDYDSSCQPPLVVDLVCDDGVDFCMAIEGDNLVYSSSVETSAVQFQHDYCWEVDSGSVALSGSGDFEATGWSALVSQSGFASYSGTGLTVTAGKGVLLSDVAASCSFSELFVSDPNGQELASAFVTDCVDLGCGCGEEGPNECDVCDGSIEDLGCGCGEPGPSGCDEQCGSTAVDLGCGCGEPVADECGVCGGDGSSCAACDDSLADLFGSLNQSQQQSVYMIESITGFDSNQYEELSGVDEPYIIAYNENGIIGYAQWSGENTELIVYGRDLEINETEDGISSQLNLCEVTGTCGYPGYEESFHIAVADVDSQCQIHDLDQYVDGVLTEYSFAPFYQGQIELSITQDCSGELGGSGYYDECETCVENIDLAGYLDECGVCNGDNACFQITNLTVDGGFNKVHLFWDAVDAEGVTYSVFRQAIDGSFSSLASGLEDPYFVDPPQAGWMLDAQTTYVYSVVAVSEAGTVFSALGAVGGDRTNTYVTSAFTLVDVCIDPAARPAFCELSPTAAGIGFLAVAMVNTVPTAGIQADLSLSSEALQFLNAADPYVPAPTGEQFIINLTGLGLDSPVLNTMRMANGTLVGYSDAGAALPALDPVIVNGALAGFSGGNFDSNLDGANDSWLVAAIPVTPYLGSVDEVTASLTNMEVTVIDTYPVYEDGEISYVSNARAGYGCDVDFNPLTAATAVGKFPYPVNITILQSFLILDNSFTTSSPFPSSSLRSINAKAGGLFLTI